MLADLLIRNVFISGRPRLDVSIRAGRIQAIGPALRCRAKRMLDGAGGELLPGLHDHHIHLLALAAQRDSVDLRGSRNEGDVASRIGEALRSRPDRPWIRATGYHEHMAGVPDRTLLDRWSPRVPLRVQHASGTLWSFNGPGIAALNGDEDEGAPLERDADGRCTGRLWRGDAWLKQRLAPVVPDLATVGRELAACGITGVTDASASTGPAEASLLDRAHSDGRLPQRLCLMSSGPIGSTSSPDAHIGPVKIMLHESALMPYDALLRTIRLARQWQRCVAFHCVTTAELALALAALDEVGGAPGDRIEHGSLIDEAAADELARRRITVVTQPAFVEQRGDMYLRDVDLRDQPDLYRCASLLRRGIQVAASSDAPYADPDPWSGIRAAARRRTRSGQPLGLAERVSAARALTMYLGPANDPGGTVRQVAPGCAADLCLLSLPLRLALRHSARGCVAATLIAGEPVYVQPHLEH
ncbi:MAG: amidohydrolase family protein [Lautropia sp.]